MAGRSTTPQTSARAQLSCSTWSHSLVSAPTSCLMSLTWSPTSPGSSTPARGSSAAGELPQHRDLFDLISFHCSHTLSFYISLSVCVFSIYEDTAAAAAGGTETQQPASTLTSKPQIQTVEIHSFYKCVGCAAESCCTQWRKDSNKYSLKVLLYNISVF